MEEFDNIKRTLRAENGDLPEELSWDNFGKKVAQKSEARVNTKNRWLWFILPLGLLVSTIVIYTISSMDETNQQPVVFQDNMNTPQSYTSDDEQVTTSDLSLDNTSETKTHQAAENTKESDNHTLTTIANASINDPKATDNATNRQTSSLDNSNSRSNIETSIVGSSSDPSQDINHKDVGKSELINGQNIYSEDNISTPSAEVANEDTPILNAKENQASRQSDFQNDEIESQNLVAIPMINTLMLDVTSKEKAILSSVPSPKLFTSNRIDAVREKFILASGGINQWSFNPSEELYEDQYSSTILGNQFGIEGGMALNKYFSVSVGIQVQNLYRKLELSSTYNVERQDSNALIEIIKNPITGVKTEVHGTAAVVDTHTLTLRHYNKFQLVNIPVRVYVHQKFGKWQIGLFGGGNYSLLRSADGKTIDDSNQSKIYAKSDGLFSTNMISLGGGVATDYNVNENIFIGLEAQYQSSLSNWLADGRKVNPDILTFGLRVGYKLR